jgi:hypothetical protein
MVLQAVKSPGTLNTSAEDATHVVETLRDEITMLRQALYLVRASLLSTDVEVGPADITKLGTVMARLSDSIVRATLAEQKLSDRSHDLFEMQAEIKRIFRSIGWGEYR